jgi:hypothetical protein
MRKLLIGSAILGLSMAIVACNKTETANDAAANEVVVEETAPVANDVMDANAAMDANATMDANAADENATEQGSTDH